MVDAAAAVQKAFDTEPEKDKDPVKEYEDAVDKTIGDGEWTEKTTMRIDMGVNKDASTAASVIECNYNLHVTDYSKIIPPLLKQKAAPPDICSDRKWIMISDMPTELLLIQ